MEATSGEAAIERLDIEKVYQSWPAPGYRQHQKQTLDAIVNVLNTHRVCILDAPVGSGKSYVLMAIADAYPGQVFYCTPQNLLIQQMLNDKCLTGKFEFIMGRRNYACVENNKTCDVGKCKVKKGYKCEDAYARCPYWLQKQRAVEHKVCLTNFSYFISEGFIPDEAQCPKLGERGLLIVDEGHAIEDVASDFVSLTVSQRTVPKSLFEKLLPIMIEYKMSSKSFDDVKKLLGEIAGFCTIEIEDFESKDELEDGEAKDREKLVEMTHKIEHVLEDEGEWIWWFEDDGSKVVANGAIKLILKPLKIDRFMDNLMWRRVDRVIIASGTPPMYPGALADIGLQKRARLVRENGRVHRENGVTIHRTIHVPSTFPVKNRPIINRSVGFMSRAHEQESLPKAIDMIDKILHEEFNVRGIIHANSYRHADLLRGKLSADNAERLVFHDSFSRNDTLKDWLKIGVPGKLIDNRVLVSVRMEEGLDLKDDLARFQVLLKVMYPSLSDKRTARRLELGERDWYSNITIMKIVQSYGRAVRSPEDWARYYVVDRNFYSLLRTAEKYAPHWFLEAVKP